MSLSYSARDIKSIGRGKMLPLFKKKTLSYLKVDLRSFLKETRYIALDERWE